VGGERPASDDLHEVLLTLSSAQFERFVRDLTRLREHGAGSNTEAIVDAVRDRARRVRVRSVHEGKAA
jgi:hypothetical protein